MSVTNEAEKKKSNIQCNTAKRNHYIGKLFRSTAQLDWLTGRI